MQTFQSNDEGLHMLDEQEYPALPPRRKLITWWMHLLMGILLLVVLVVFVASGYMTILTWTSRESQAGFDIAAGHFLLLFSGVLAASFLLLWAGWKHAITFFLVPAVIIVFILFLIMLGTVGSGIWNGLYCLPYFTAHGGLALKLYTIQDEWHIRPHGR